MVSYPRRLQSGQITCYLNRTYHVLTTNRVSAVDNPMPDAFGKLYDSQTVWYKITGLGDYIRPIGEKNKESAADTAVRRLENAGSKYQPPNLKDFLAHQGKVSQVLQEGDSTMKGVLCSGPQ